MRSAKNARASVAEACDRAVEALLGGTLVAAIWAALCAVTAAAVLIGDLLAASFHQAWFSRGLAELNGLLWS